MNDLPVFTLDGSGYDQWQQYQVTNTGIGDQFYPPQDNVQRFNGDVPEPTGLRLMALAAIIVFFVLVRKGRKGGR